MIGKEIYLSLAVFGTLLVTNASCQTITVAPSTLSFEIQEDSATLPISRTLQISSSEGNIPFTAHVAPVGVPPYPLFLSINPTSGTTPATLTVTLLPIVLNWTYGSYANGVSAAVSNPDGTAAAIIPVSLLINLPPPPTINSIVNASTLQPGISPGAIVTILGDHLGPPGGAASGPSNSTLHPEQFFYPTGLGNTVVTFNGVPAPLLYVGANQVNAIVPFDVTGQSNVNISLQHSFITPATFTATIQDTSPGIFTIPPTGNGQGAIINYGGYLNGPDHPAPAGSPISIYATGAGVWNPTLPNGLVVSQAPPFPIPRASVSVTIGGQPAQVTYAGVAPGMVAGLLQVNAIVPNGLAPGPQTVILKMGSYDNSSQQVTVEVQ